MDKTAAVLFGKTRQSVLSILYDNPGRQFYLRQLARATGISPGAIQYELRNLVDADLVARKLDAGRAHYSANTAHPVFEELRSVLRKTSGIPGAIRQALDSRAGDIDLALIYGSVAKGWSRSQSDVDLLVVGRISFGDLVALLAPLEAQLSREISPRLYSVQEFRDRLQKKDRFLSGILTGPVAVLKGDPRDLG